MPRLIMAGLITLILSLNHAYAQGLSDVRAGNNAFKDGDLIRAVELFTRAIASGDLSEDALSITLNNRGVVQGEIGNYDAAITDYGEALQLRPNDETTRKNLRVAHVRRGQASLSNNDPQAALVDFDEAIVIQPDHYLAYVYRAQLYVDQGDLELAMIDLERATMLQPDDPKSQEALAQVQHDLTLARDLQGSSPPSATQTAGSEPQPGQIEQVVQTSNAGAVDTTSAEPVATVEVEATRPEPATTAQAEATPETETIAAVQPQTDVAAANPPRALLRVEQEPQVESIQEPETPRAPPVIVFAGDEQDGEKMRTISAVNYRSGPSNDDPRIGTVDEGAVVTVVGDTLGWKHIILANGDRGFIYKNWLEPANE